MRLRVLHAPFDVAGQASSLASAERSVGLASESVALSRSGTARELQRWQLLRRALRDFDVVHFNFGSTFLARYWPSAHHGVRAPFGWYARAIELRDLAWLKRAGKAVFVTFQGDDVRTCASVRARLGDAAWIDDYYDARDDARKEIAAARIVAGADGVFALNPDLVALLPGSQFLPYASVDLEEYRSPKPVSHERPVVVHAPTDRHAKGTDDIAAAVARLPGVDLRLVEGVARADARAAIEHADVVVDQVRIGWYGATAVEAMALGRPVIAYLHEPSLGAVPAEMRAELPVLSATANTLADAIEDALARREELGRRGRAFVERWHDPLRIAEGLRGAYEEAVARIERR